MLTEELVFPPPGEARSDGLLAVGGDLSAERLMLAYSMGVFPWYSEGSPILWWSPDPRQVLYPEELKVPRSLRQTIKRGTYEITMDRAFDDILSQCAGVHAEADGGTWITPDMRRAYGALHAKGAAHSVEAWHGGDLAGGLYGVALGAAYFGESMFSRMPDSSKAAFVHLVQRLRDWGFMIIDCQVRTEHLSRFGAREIPRRDFIEIITDARAREAGPGSKSWDSSP